MKSVDEEVDILDSTPPEENLEKITLIDLRKRAIAFLLDYGLLIFLVYLSYKILLLFTESVSADVIYVILSIYSLIFIFFEHKNNGSIFKKLLKIETKNMDGRKLGIHIYIIKMFLRPIAFLVALLYCKLLTIILLWIVGVYKPAFKFFRGEYFTLWYDYSIKQMTIDRLDKDSLVDI